MIRAPALLALLALACSTQPPPPPIVSGPDCSEKAPCPLVPGTPAKNGIALKGEVDFFTVTVPADRATKRTILHLALDSEAPVTPVRFVMLVEMPGGLSVVGSIGPAPNGGTQHLAANLLVPGPGVYPILVRDVQSTGADPHNGYSISAQILDDPDTAEPDDLIPTARALTAGTASGFIGERGDRDLVQFEVTTGTLDKITLTQAETKGPVKLHMRVLQRSSATPDDLATVTAETEVTATKAGAAVASTITRYFAAGRYLVELTDAGGTEADVRATAAWTLAIAPQGDPDPLEQTSRNDNPDAATTLLPGASPLAGVIGSQGDRDWYRVSLPASDDAKLLEIRFDPKQSNNEVELLWAVGEKLASPAGACDTTCGPAFFCAGTKCGYKLRALRGYAKGDGTAQILRIRQQGAAKTIDIAVSDQGDDGRTLLPYSISATVISDPDAHEPQASNDTRGASTAVAGTRDADGTVHFQASGQVSWWEYVDGKATYQQGADGDWYELELPAREPAPECPVGADGGVDSSPDAGCFDTAAGTGTPYLPRPIYSLALRWKGPDDGTYKIGVQGVVPIDATRSACRFSFDDKFARTMPDGRFTYGDLATDPCFCLPAAQAELDKLWVKVEAAHRPDPPERNKYSDQPYAFEFVMTPNALQTACQAKCVTVTQSSTCPGE